LKQDYSNTAFFISKFDTLNNYVSDFIRILEIIIFLFSFHRITFILFKFLNSKQITYVAFETSTPNNRFAGQPPPTLLARARQNWRPAGPAGGSRRQCSIVIGWHNGGSSGRGSYSTPAGQSRLQSAGARARFRWARSTHGGRLGLSVFGRVRCEIILIYFAC